jgi:hypothetical protein
MRKTLIGVVMMLVIMSSVRVEAAPAYSWNLSRDMVKYGIATNPFGLGGVWTAMYDPAGTSHISAGYVQMPNFNPAYSPATSAWEVPGEPYLTVGVQGPSGMPVLHPGTKFSSIIAWTSPIKGTVNIMGIISDADGYAGNGINWFVDKDNSTLLSGTVNSIGLSSSGQTILKENIPVVIGTRIYFIVSSKNNDRSHDTTLLDLLITSP